MFTASTMRDFTLPPRSSGQSTIRWVMTQKSAGLCIMPILQCIILVHSVEQKSIGLKFSNSRTGSDVRFRT